MKALANNPKENLKRNKSITRTIMARVMLFHLLSLNERSQLRLRSNKCFQILFDG